MKAVGRVIGERERFERAAEEGERVPSDQRAVNVRVFLGRAVAEGFADAPADFGVSVEPADFVGVGVKRIPSPLRFPVGGLNLGGGFLERVGELGERRFRAGNLGLKHRAGAARVVDRADGGLHEDLVAAMAGGNAGIVIVHPSRSVVFVEAADGLKRFAAVVGDRTGDGIDLGDGTGATIGGEGAEVAMTRMKPEAGDDATAFGLDAPIGINEARADDARLGVSCERRGEQGEPGGRFDHHVGMEANDVASGGGGVGDGGVERVGGTGGIRQAQEHDAPGVRAGGECGEDGGGFIGGPGVHDDQVPVGVFG